MKNYIKISIAILCCFFVFSCDDYLDVRPEDKYLESDVFKTEEGIQSVLNGVYLSMAAKSLYGGNLTMSTIELFAQRYNTNENHDFFNYSTYEYDQSTVKSSLEQIWGETYITILNLNKLIENLNTFPDVISEEKANIFKGEAHGLRAMLHFDLLRLFGPVYEVTPSSLSIPYYKKAETEIAPLLSASDVITEVLNDLTTAEQFLATDPIIENGTLVSDTGDFYENRNLRFNKYAVKALEARVHLYAGNKTEALLAAKVVIDEAKQWFPWSSRAAVIEGEDRVFSSEVIFAVQNLTLYDRQDEYFDSNLNDDRIFAPLLDRLNEDIFESNFNDYRYISSWAFPTVGGKPYKTFFKFQETQDDTDSFKYMQPLIRISEIYYIAAECETNLETALDYLNTVRLNRGLIDVPNTVDLEAEIFKEYNREFIGEGQLFFYYKRKNTQTILRGYSVGTIDMNESQYVAPLPDSETIYRD